MEFLEFSKDVQLIMTLLFSLLIVALGLFLSVSYFKDYGKRVIFDVFLVLAVFLLFLIQSNNILARHDNDNKPTETLLEKVVVDLESDVVTDLQRKAIISEIFVEHEKKETFISVYYLVVFSDTIGKIEGKFTQSRKFKMEGNETNLNHMDSLVEDIKKQINILEN